MNFESVCNMIEDEQQLSKQAKEPYEVEGRDYAVACRTCNSNVISPRVFPTSSYHPCMYIYNCSDWEICEELRLRELEEAKARAAQMEKTMRWWSDCTANWREKWSKVRAERNRAREEGRELRLKLEATIKELSALKKINHGLLSENEVEAGNTWRKNFGCSETGSFWMQEYHLEPLENNPTKYVQDKSSEILYATKNTSGNHQDARFNLEILDSGGNCTASLENPNPKKDNPLHSQDDEVTQMSGLHMHLQESQKILQKEQKIRSSLEKELKKLKSEKSLWKWKYEELRRSNQENLKQNGVESIVEDFEENAEARSQQDVKIWELQTEMERLQSENVSEWKRRKILETEKQELERENRRLKTQVKDLQDLLGKESKQSAIHLCGDLKAKQSEQLEKNKV
ncbi:coiled-coil domain-containing protein 102B [Tiliqua scincoides]|uniref:coiled-coil domain-containing protein 102B n=1 Tax=Tiliqua scincoides TaxID=71010 RepID=UPI003462C4B6